MKRGFAGRKNSARRKKRRRKGLRNKPRRKLLVWQKIFPPHRMTFGHVIEIA